MTEPLWNLRNESLICQLTIHARKE